MKYLGLDLGTKTLGIALSDRAGIIATPYKILRHDENYKSLINPLKEIIKENDVAIIVLGFPKNMNNTVGPRAELTLKFKKMLMDELQVEVIMQDERLSTKQANDTLILSDASRKKRKNVVDKVAATIILQTFLDTRKD